MAELTKKLWCVKYSLMACNAFGLMLAFMAVLFGLAYPEENFPGGYTGKETAGMSGFFIIFTLIGYYGAHRQKIYFLVPYSIIILLFVGGNVFMWAIKPEESVLDPDSNALPILGGMFLVLMVFAIMLAWQEKKKTTAQAQVTSGYPNLPLSGLDINSKLLMNDGGGGNLLPNGPMDPNQVNLIYQTLSNSYVTVPRFNGLSMPSSMGGPVVMY